MKDFQKLTELIGLKICNYYQINVVTVLFLERKKVKHVEKDVQKDFCLSHKKSWKKRVEKTRKKKKTIVKRTKEIIETKEKIQNEGTKLQNYFNNF